MPTKFTAGSLTQIATVHPKLQALCHRALVLSPVDFKILQGMRTAAQQLKAYQGGFSKIKSGGRHQFGCAVDFMVKDPATGKFTFSKPPLYAKVREAFKAASKELGTPIRTLEHIGDLGHIELPKSYMPDNWNKGKPVPAATPVKPAPAQPELSAASIKDIQRRLIAHGYVQVGGVDGEIGDNTRGAIRDFRAKNGLPDGDHIDKAFTDALMKKDAVRPVIAPERSQATVADLREKGSDIIKGTDIVKGAAGIAGAGTVAQPALKFLSDTGEQVSQITDALTPFQTLMAFFADWLWVPVVIVLGVGGAYAFKIAKARLRDHQLNNTSVVNLPEKVDG